MVLHFFAFAHSWSHTKNKRRSWSPLCNEIFSDGIENYVTPINLGWKQTRLSANSKLVFSFSVGTLSVPARVAAGPGCSPSLLQWSPLTQNSWYPSLSFQSRSQLPGKLPRFWCTSRVWLFFLSSAPDKNKQSSTVHKGNVKSHFKAHTSLSYAYQ